MLHLKRFDEGVWFDYPGFEGVRLKIKPITDKDLGDLTSSVRQKMGVVVEGKTEIVEDHDWAAFTWKLFCLALQEWEGIAFDGAKEPTREQMLLSIFQDEGLRNFIFEKSKIAKEKEKEKLEGELKNLKSSESGSPSSRD